MGAQKTINKTPLIFSSDCVPLKFLVRNLSSLYLSNLCRYSTKMYKYINKHSLLMLENKNLNSIKIIDEGWGKLGDKKSGRRGPGGNFFVLKTKSSIIYFCLYS